MLPEHFYLQSHEATVVDFAVASAEDTVPKEGHLLPQLPWVVYHPKDPFHLVIFQGLSAHDRRSVTHEEVLFDTFLTFRRQELLDSASVSFGEGDLIPFEIVA